MAETKNPGEKKLSVAPTKTLTLKRGVEQGVVRQSFSHGRTKAVVVEKVKRRTLGPSDAKAPEPAAAPEAGPAARRTAGKPATPAPAPAAAGRAAPSPPRRGVRGPSSSPSASSAWVRAAPVRPSFDLASSSPNRFLASCSALRLASSS